MAALSIQWRAKLKSKDMCYRAPAYRFEKLVPQLKTSRFIYDKILEQKTNILINQENKREATIYNNANPIRVAQPD